MQSNQATVMAILTVEVKDEELTFFKNLLQHFPFVQIRDNEPDEDTDQQVIANIRQGVRELRLVEQGKLKSTPFNEFLKELDELQT